ncbi:DUF2500 domain-containing protein [Clostridium sp.]|uniref:DUF2500 domain-containing protein n=1 Tax=Clostridium sp. TaxID=1506 RepID=UPI00261CE1C8|nr:DUF2500 domain-containing protein [Clostridium sp.]
MMGGFMFGGIFNLFFYIIPLIMFGMIAFFIYGAIKENRYNNSQPIIPVEAKIIGKRTHVSRGTNNHSASTSYHITFELINAERLELKVSYNDYAYIVEGDKGILTFQGRRFISFERKL